MADIVQPMRFEIDIKTGLVTKPQRTILMKGDRNANRIIAALTDDGKAVDLSGVTVTGRFIRPPDGAEVMLTGEASGGEASVTLVDQCYAADGHYEASIILTMGSVRRTILSISGTVHSAGSGAYVDADDVIPSVDDILAQYAKMQQVTTSASNAASRANAAATRAENMLMDAEGMAGDSNRLNGKEASFYTNPENLLDNSDFRNPVNQRNNTSYSGGGYTIDRWKLSAESLTVNSDSITLTGSSASAVLTQYMTALRNGTYTFAAKINGEVKTCVFSISRTTITTIDNSNAAYTGGYLQVVFSANLPAVQIRANAGYSVSVDWAALYEGSYTADSAPPHTPKGHAAELAECQRYYRKIKCGNAYLQAYAFSATSARLFLPYGMRTVPTILFDSAITLRDYSTGTSYAISEVSSSYTTDSGFLLTITSSGLTTGQTHGLTSGSVAGEIEITADL